MATRRQIREAFYAELEAAVPSSGNSGHVPAGDIGQEMPESDEDLPTIVHNDRYRPIPMNRASDAPTRVETDQSGNVTNEVYGEMQEAVFDVLLIFLDEDAKEDCYEAVRSYFEKFEASASTWDPTTIHSGVERVTVGEVGSEDDPDAEPKRFGDRLRINLEFQREFFFPDEGSSGDSIQQVDHEVDADNDGTTDATFTTT